MSWKDEFRLKIEASMVGTPACIEIPRFSDSEIGVDMASIHDDYVIAVAMAYQIPTRYLDKQDKFLERYNLVPLPPNYFQDEWKLFYEEIKPIFDKHFQEQYILSSWAMPVILLVAFVILTMIIGA